MYVIKFIIYFFCKYIDFIAYTYINSFYFNEFYLKLLFNLIIHFLKNDYKNKLFSHIKTIKLKKWLFPPN
ncbi:MAG: hypothetical protein EAZ06_10460 [Cytophagales bacterium]|nr:MAG: hypothetical protein EAZ06_10460 [Cytophagales bacterium]